MRWSRSAGRGPRSAPRPPLARRTTTAAWWRRLDARAGSASRPAAATPSCASTPSEAPLQSIAFLKLAEQGFYDGTQVYRVLPGRRLEAGDPDGDGRGGPGFTLRDEPGPRRLEPGCFRAGPARPPRGGEPLLRPARPRRRSSKERSPGWDEVVSGLEVLAGLLEGDRIVRLREIAAPAELHSGLPPPARTGR